MGREILKGKTALITGGTSGIGFATAKRFVEEGAKVYITGRRKAELDVATRRLGSNGVGVQGDVANLGDLDRLFMQIKAESGTLDVVFANAGTGSIAPLGQITEEQVSKVFDVNVKGVIFTVQKSLPLLRDGSSIILNASIAGSDGAPAFSVYGASKAAVRSLARGWTSDLRSRRIRVNAVSPGVIPTEGYSTSLGMTDEQVKRLSEQKAKEIPLGRVGTPEEIANAVLFLASDESSYITGIELFVDGGLIQVK